MSFSQKVIRGLAWGQIGMLGRTLICFGISIIVARSLGAEQYGVYAAVISVVLMLVRFTEMGSESVINTYLPKYFSQHHSGKAGFLARKVLGYRTLLVIGVSAAIYGLSATTINPLEDVTDDFLVLGLAWFVIRSIMDTVTYLVWSRMAMKYYAIVEIVISIGQLLGVLLLHSRGMQVKDLLVLMLLVNGSQLLAYAYFSRWVLTVKVEAVNIRPIMQFALTIWASTVLHYFISKGIDIVMIVHYMHDTRQAAYYDIAFLLVMTGALALLPAIDSLKLPILSEAYHRYGMDGMRQSWTMLSKISIYLTVPALIFLMVNAEPIVLLCYGQSYLESVELIQVFCFLTMLALCLANEASPIILFPLNKEKLYLLLHGSQGIVNLLLNIWLIPTFGAMGAVIATGMARLLLSAIELIVALRIMQTQLPYRFIISLAFAVSVSLWLVHLLPHRSLSELLGSALIYALSTTLLLTRLHNFSERERNVLKQFKPKLYFMLMKYKLI